jgi:hypothetical protein
MHPNEAKVGQLRAASRSTWAPTACTRPAAGTAGSRAARPVLKGGEWATPVNVDHDGARRATVASGNAGLPHHPEEASKRLLGGAI